jgi:hypothetical protein
VTTAPLSPVPGQPVAGVWNRFHDPLGATYARFYNLSMEALPRWCVARRMVACVLDARWTIDATAQRFQLDAKTVRKWRTGSLPKATRACSTAPVARGVHRRAPRGAFAGG